MFRSLLQIYVKGKDKAFQLYQKAFDAEIGCKDVDENGVVIHQELNIMGQAFAVGEASDDTHLTGNIMQFCLQFGEGNEGRIKNAYECLIEGGKTLTPPGEFSFSTYGVEFIDTYGVWWCLFI